jgi:lysophospholipase L1-like esterase
MNWETYIAFGDSITIGARSYLGYPEYISNILESQTKKNWNVINHAVSGYTAIDLARSIDINIHTLKESGPSICSLLIGTNDIKSNTGIDDFEIAFNQVLIKIKLIIIPRQIKVFEIPKFPRGIMYPYTFEMNDKIPLFNDVIRKLAALHEIPCHPIHFEMEELYDGVHLNKDGCQSFAQYISSLILNDRGIS